MKIPLLLSSVSVGLCRVSKFNRCTRTCVRANTSLLYSPTQPYIGSDTAA